LTGRSAAAKYRKANGRVAIPGYLVLLKRTRSKKPPGRRKRIEARRRHDNAPWVICPLLGLYVFVRLILEDNYSVLGF